jgi:hypothetical protein
VAHGQADRDRERLGRFSFTYDDNKRRGTGRRHRPIPASPVPFEPILYLFGGKAGFYYTPAVEITHARDPDPDAWPPTIR